MPTKDTTASTEIFKVHHKDARKLTDVLNQQIVDVTITSPPYFDLKDYGYIEQIGYGQGYQTYLEDLTKVFKNVFDCTKDTGSLWVIIDSFRSNGEVVPLPFDFAHTIKSIGWKFQEVIIWKKDRTVPWSHKGQMRNLFEYILLFSKTDRYNFHIDEVRDVEVLKKWWVKYPERYNPKGKTPDGLWEFDIPTQGSWGDGYIRHFCPLPEEMIARILKLTTKENDVVLDPFAGSGAVLAKADNMRRKFIGFELNPEYIKMFESYMQKTGEKKRKVYDNASKISLSQQKFESMIINLRLLKFARVLYSKLPDKIKGNVSRIFVERLTASVTKKNAKCVGRYVLKIKPRTDSRELENAINALVSKPPLSKFGVEANLEFKVTDRSFADSVRGTNLYTYTNKDTHHYKHRISLQSLNDHPFSEIILSNIKVKLVEKDYE